MNKMDQSVQLIKEHARSEQAQVFFVDGCKVTVRYSEHKNPAAIKNIKGALLAGISSKKS